MTKDDRADRSPRTVRGVLALATAFVLAMFALGILTATFQIIGEAGPTPELAVYVSSAMAALLLVLALWLAYRNRAVLHLARSPRQREAGLMLYLGGAIGFAAVVALIWLAGEDFGIAMIFSDEPLTLAVALVLAGAFTIGMALSVRWLLLLDEHERAAHDFGTVLAFYVYLTISAIWWLLARGGLVPWPDGVLIFWLSLAVWVAGWAWRRRS